jgi:aminoglycoside 3-N-acetyltransferase
MIIGSEKIQEDLFKLGIDRGDVLLLSADVGSIGLIGSSRSGEIRRNLISALLDVVGEDGTIVTVAFTKSFNLYHKFDDRYVFKSTTPSTAGALARAFLEHPEVVRSHHPTCSFAAIGKKAKEILGNHGPEANPYDPVGKVIELKGKVMLVGCADYKNGLHIIHYAQQFLGLSRQNIFANKMGVLYEENGDVKLFRQKDFGGCSRGFYKFYGDLIVQNILSVGYIGKAYSVLAPGKESFDCVVERLSEDPTYALCEHPDCFSCRGCWKYNKSDWAAYYGFYLWKNLFSKNIEDATC